MGLKDGDFILVDGKLQVVTGASDNGYSTRPPTDEEQARYDKDNA